MRSLWPSLALPFLACLLGASAYAAAPRFVEFKTLALKDTFGTKKDWKVTAYQPEQHETGDVAAKVCFWFDPAQKETACKPIHSSYGLQSLTELSVVPVRHSKPAVWGVLLTAYSTGGGSGSQTAVAIWTYDSINDEFMRAVSTDVSEIGEYRVLSEGPLAGCLVTARGLWGGDEGHFGPHHFSMGIFKYGQLGDGYARYFLILQYITEQTYESEEIRVIAPELDKIIRLLGIVYPKDNVIR